MATPSYKGPGQPGADSGGWLGSWLGGTPAYKGAGQSAQRSSMLAGSVPVYKPAPENVDSSAQVTACVLPDANGPGPIAIVIPREVIDQQ